MEGGSLLQEAIQYVEEHRDVQDTSELWIDVFHLTKSSDEDQGKDLVRFASLAHEFNRQTQACRGNNYPWYTGGEGPVFGVRVASVSDPLKNSGASVPHLRSICRYGPSVQDEWLCIALAAQISLQNPQVVVQCWDVEDGHLLLIEAAQHLPEWVDKIGPNNCRHRCFFHCGKVTLIRPQTDDDTQQIHQLTLEEALRNIADESELLDRPIGVNSAISQKIQPFKDAMKGDVFSPQHLLHRAPLVLPLRIAQLVNDNPGLVNGAVRSFANHSPGVESSPIEWEDLVWTTHSFSRTSYAMLRSIVTKQWPSESYVPPAYKSIETVRMKRQCQMEATPHLINALQLGMRLTAGFEYILTQQRPTKNRLGEITAQDRILNHWVDMDIQCGGDGEWLRQSWVAGPNGSITDLSALIKCPITTIDLSSAFPFPIRYPLKSWHSIVRDAFQKGPSKEKSPFQIPQSDDVDSEDWLHNLDGELSKHDEQQTHSTIHQNQESYGRRMKTRLDHMLGSLDDFLEEDADIDGIVTHVKSRVPIVQSDKEDEHRGPLDINPRIFLNLLSTTLKSTPQELGSLLASNASRAPSSHRDHRMEEDEKVEIITNLLESVGIASGGPGPLQNIVGEMGQILPDM